MQEKKKKFLYVKDEVLFLAKKKVFSFLDFRFDMPTSKTLFSIKSPPEDPFNYPTLSMDSYYKIISILHYNYIIIYIYIYTTNINKIIPS